MEMVIDGRTWVVEFLRYIGTKVVDGEPAVIWHRMVVNDAKLAELRPLIDAKVKEAKPHKPGDGYHLVPGYLSLYLQDGAWNAALMDSSGAIQVHLWQVCTHLEIDPSELFKTAQVEPYSIGEEDIDACARPAVPNDVWDVIADLDDVNEHALSDALYRKVKEMVRQGQLRDPEEIQAQEFEARKRARTAEGCR